jgi:hypothetical protein
VVEGYILVLKQVFYRNDIVSTNVFEPLLRY